MSAMAGSPAGFPSWTVRNGPWLLLAFLLPFVIAPPVYVIARYNLSGVEEALVALAAVALGSLQLRHSLAAARGTRPTGWPVTLAAMVGLAYIPWGWFEWDWAPTQYMVLGSVGLLLRERIVVPIVVVVLAGNAAVFAGDFVDSGAGPGETIFWTLYWEAILVMGTVALYGSVRLVRVADELEAARLELAELAVGRERLRVSRDLHDVLGQSLSAVSLKGDLALRLLPSDPAAARAEVEGLTDLARGALRDMRAVTQDRHVVSLRTEVDAAAALLSAAGVATEIEVELDGLAPASDEVLAWTVREGTTNLLRHSDARHCRIRATRYDGTVALEILNDGVRRPMVDTDGGTGLSGLVARARARGGSVTAGLQAEGRFRLLVEVEEQP